MSIWHKTSQQNYKEEDGKFSSQQVKSEMMLFLIEMILKTFEVKARTKRAKVYARTCFVNQGSE